MRACARGDAGGTRAHAGVFARVHASALVAPEALVTHAMGPLVSTYEKKARMGGSENLEISWHAVQGANVVQIRAFV